MKQRKVLIAQTGAELTLTKKSPWIEMWKNKWFYLFILPAILVLFLFSYKPMYGIVIAFKDFKIRKGILGSEWIGFYHFQRMFKYGNFWRLIRNSLFIAIAKIGLGLIANLTLALLFNELQNMKFKRIVQSVSYLPHFISWVILGGILRELLSPTRGVVNEVVKFFGGTPIYFLADSDYFVGVLLISNLWQGVGWGTIIYLAAIAGISQDQYESAIIDGASRFQRAIYITLPSIAPTVCTLLILNMGSVLNAGFDQIFNLYNDQVYDVADIIDTYVYRLGLESFDYAYSAAVGLFKNVIGIIMVLGSNLLMKKITNGEYRIW